jgi:hypothetical protein
VLVREHQGQRHTVTVARDGFDWQGTTYPSLSAIARAITGTAWSGPRFFALHGAGDGAKPKNKSTAGPNHGRHQHRPAAGRNSPLPNRECGGTIAPMNPSRNPQPLKIRSGEAPQRHASPRPAAEKFLHTSKFALS